MTISTLTEEENKLRLGLPTASVLNKLLTKDGKLKALGEGVYNYVGQLCFEKQFGFPINPFKGNPATEHGKEYEDQARLDYELQNNVKVEKGGFIVHKSGLFGASPDGLVGDKGMVEFKCPQPAMMFRYLGGVGTDYTNQKRVQMFADEREWNRLYVFGYWKFDDRDIQIKPVMIETLADKEWESNCLKACEKLCNLRDEWLKTGEYEVFMKENESDGIDF